MSPRLIGAGVVALVAATGLAAVGHYAHRAGADGVRAEYAAAFEAAAEQARILSRDRAATAERIDRETVQKLRAADRRAVDVRIAGDGLRFALGRQPAAAADAGVCGAERERAERVAQLLGACGRLVEEGAGIVDGAVILIDGLQARE